VANTGQQGFGFALGAEPAAAEHAPIGDGRFQDDDPYHLVIGTQRLDRYLVDAGLEWAIRLRKLMASLDYSLMTMRYSHLGRRAFHPRTMLGLIIYGMLVRQFGLRDLENLSALNLGAWWICGGHRIDHSTIGKFVQMHEEVLGDEFFVAVTQWVVSQLNVRAGTAAIDGTVVESAASHWRAIKAEALRAAAEQARNLARARPDDTELKQASADATRLAEVAEQRCKRREQQGKDSSSVAVVPSDPDAVIQPRKDGAMRPGYKPCTLMHESGVIIGQEVHPSSETAVVGALLEQHAQVLGEAPKRLLLDGGFHNGPLLRELSEQGIDVLCPSGQTLGNDHWEKKGAGGRFAKSEFGYDQDRDVYRCPTGAELSCTAQGRDGHGRTYRVFRTAACASCTLREQCTTSPKGRSLKRYDAEEYKEGMAVVLRQDRARTEYRRRMAIAEPVYAELRERLGLRRFRRRGLIAVQAEFALYCIAFNLKKTLAGGSVAFIWVIARRLEERWEPVAVMWSAHGLSTATARR
jgi:transposase